MKKKRSGLKLKDFLREELRDPEIAKHYHAAKAASVAAEAVIKAREKAKLTQAELAKRLHTTQQAISRIEAGEQNTTVGMLWKIAQATGTSFDLPFRPE